MHRLVSAFLVLAASGCSSTEERVECPAPESGRLGGTLRETPEQIKAAGEQLGQGSENEIAEVAARVRARHADATPDEVVNYLVTAYCPKINTRATLDKAAKQQALRSFSARVERIVRPAR